jgi:hypothetical protein
MFSNSSRTQMMLGTLQIFSYTVMQLWTKVGVDVCLLLHPMRRRQGSACFCDQGGGNLLQGRAGAPVQLLPHLLQLVDLARPLPGGPCNGVVVGGHLQAKVERDPVSVFFTGRVEVVANAARAPVPSSDLILIALLNALRDAKQKGVGHLLRRDPKQGAFVF